MIHSHKGRSAARVAEVGLGVSCDYKGLFFHSMSPENLILIEICVEISRNMEQ